MPHTLLRRRVAPRHLEPVLQEVAHDGEGTSFQPEPIEDEPHRTLDVLVGIEARALLRLVPDVACRRLQPQLAPARLVQFAAMQAQTQPGQLDLAHRALEPQQQPVVSVARRVDRLLIEQDHVGQPAQVQQPVPIRRGACEPRDLEREDGADTTVGDFLREMREAAAWRGARRAVPQVLVDDLNALGGPAQLTGASLQIVLARGRLGMVAHLARIGLPQVDDRSALQVGRLDLVAHHRPPRAGRRERSGERASPTCPAGRAARRSAAHPAGVDRVDRSGAVASTGPLGSLGFPCADSCGGRCCRSSVSATAAASSTSPRADSGTSRSPTRGGTRGAPRSVHASGSTIISRSGPSI